MNQMLEVWKEIPDPSDEDSLPPESQASNKGNLLVFFKIFLCLGFLQTMDCIYSVVIVVPSFVIPLV